MDSGFALRAPRNDGSFIVCHCPPPMHETDFSHEHVETAAERAAIVRTIWDQDNVSFKTVGIDIGSSTSHLLFAKVALQRQSQGLSSRFVVIGREIVWRSPILLTPFLPDGTIDAAELGSSSAAVTAKRVSRRARSIPGRSFLPARRSSVKMPAPSMSCLPPTRENSSAPRPATSSNAGSPRTDRAPWRCPRRATLACFTPTLAAAPPSSP